MLKDRAIGHWDNHDGKSDHDDLNFRVAKVQLVRENFAHSGLLVAPLPTKPRFPLLDQGQFRTLCNSLMRHSNYFIYPRRSLFKGFSIHPLCRTRTLAVSYPQNWATHCFHPEHPVLLDSRNAIVRLYLEKRSWETLSPGRGLIEGVGAATAGYHQALVTPLIYSSKMLDIGNAEQKLSTRKCLICHLNDKHSKSAASVTPSSTTLSCST